MLKPHLKSYLCPLLFSALAVLPGVRALAAPVELQSLKTHSRLSLKIGDGAEPVWKEVAGGFELLLKGVGLLDLGVPLGGEDALAKQIARLSDTRLASLSLSEAAGGLKIVGRWKFATGDDAPANPRMEHFDFHQKTPPQYVIDFWPLSGPSVREMRATKVKSDRLAAEKKAEEKARERAARRVAAEKSRAEAEDTFKFCRQPLDEKNDVFLPFLPVHQKVNFARWFPVTTPDEHFFYFEPKNEEKDAQYVRLALRLYRQGKTALVIRTLDFFDKEFSKSTHRHEMRFLRANALVKLGVHDQSREILQSLVTDAAESPVALHSGMYLAGKAIHQAPLLALENFLWLINHHSSNRLNWVFHLGVAEALYAMRQTERAAKEYQWVSERAPDGKSRAQGGLRMGDLYLERKQYDRALAAYFQGMEYFKDESREFPAIHLNRAESLYWLGEYDRAKDAFNSFLTAFPSHPEGWRAAFRLGEIHGRKGGPENMRDARNWFYETINRFPFSPGATLARSRLLPCGDHAGFKLEAAERFFEQEAAKFDGGGQVSTERYQDFRMLSHIRTLISLGTEGQAVEAAAQELLGNPKSEARQLIADTLGALFRKTVVALLHDGKKYEAIRFYRDRVGLMPEGQRSETDYLLRLSRAASDLGLATLARDLLKTYEATSGRGPAGQSIAQDSDDLDGNLRLSEESYTKAKALWLSSGMKEEPGVRALLSKVVEESPFSLEREILFGLMDERQDKPASALGHATKSELLLPAEASEDKARVTHWIAALHAKAGSQKTALDLYRGLEDRVRAAAKTGAHPHAAREGVTAALGVPAVPGVDELIIVQGELLQKQGRWGDAAAAYARSAGEKTASNRLLFEYARALARTGEDADLAKSKSVLEGIAQGKQDDFWKKLARETLANRSIAKEGMK